MKIIAAVFYSLLCLYSCKTDTPVRDNKMVEDMVLEKFISITDTLPFYDTTNTAFGLISAIAKADTSRMKKEVELFYELSLENEWRQMADSCVKNRLFETAGKTAVEKYEFEFGQVFFPEVDILSFARFEDSIILKKTVYQYADDKRPCNMVDEYIVRLDSSDWQLFNASLKKADFWGLKPTVVTTISHCSILTVKGYRQNDGTGRAASAIVSRCNGVTTIFETYELLWQMAERKKSKGKI